MHCMFQLVALKFSKYNNNGITPSVISLSSQSKKINKTGCERAHECANLLLSAPEELQPAYVSWCLHYVQHMPKKV